MIKFFRKYHKWAGLIMILLIVLFAVSGIILNHRPLFSSVDVNRKYLPENYQLRNWNLAHIRSAEKISPDSILFYGYAGVWLSDSTCNSIKDFNQGFPQGVDNRKIFKLLVTSDKKILAAAFSGLYQYNLSQKKWISIKLPVREKNVVDLLKIHDSIYVLTRSDLMTTVDMKNFIVKKLPSPPGYDNKTGLFKTLWVIHSGEIYGLAGKLIVDLAALIFVILSITGLIQYLNKKNLKIKVIHKSRRKAIKKSFKFNLKWHHRTGWITISLLIITTLTGIFLRPPLLIAIAQARVSKIPLTILDTPNPWFDELRRIHYIPEKNLMILVSANKFYYSRDNFTNDIQLFDNQPPISIMGVTVLENYGNDKLLIGSFTGLYRWNYNSGEVFDMLEGKIWVRPTEPVSPVGNYKISGYTDKIGRTAVVFDYDKGTLIAFNRNKMPEMPQSVIEKSPISLWNLAQEFHTGRFYQFLIGKMYILVVPLTGLGMLVLVFSGFIIRRKYHKKKKSS